jgi:hypothetical protein
MPVEVVNLPCGALERNLRSNMRQSVWKYRQLDCSQHQPTPSNLKVAAAYQVSDLPFALFTDKRAVKDDPDLEGAYTLLVSEVLPSL